MPIYKKEDAKSGGFQQVRESLQVFEGDVVKVEEGQWGGQLVDDSGKLRPPKEYFEVETINNVALEVTEDLSMDISEKFSFRINMSEYAGSFWVDSFLESADKNKVLLPDGLKGKRVTFRKVTLEGTEPKFNVTNFVIDKVVAKKPATVAAKIATKPVAKPVVSQAPMPTLEQEEAVTVDEPMALVLELAVGKTEQQLRSATSLHPKLVGSPLLPLIKAGLVTASLLNEGKLVLTDGKYQKPE